MCLEQTRGAGVYPADEAAAQWPRAGGFAGSRPASPEQTQGPARRRASAVQADSNFESGTPASQEREAQKEQTPAGESGGTGGSTVQETNQQKKPHLSADRLHPGEASRPVQPTGQEQVVTKYTLQGEPAELSTAAPTSGSDPRTPRCSTGRHKGSSMPRSILVNYGVAGSGGRVHPDPQSPARSRGSVPVRRSSCSSRR